MSATTTTSTATPLPLGVKLAAGVLVVIVVLAVCADVIAAALGVSGTATDLAGRYADAGVPHVLGQNELGQDLFVRLLLGARVSLVVGVLAAVVAGTVGVAVGVAAAAGGGIVDTVLMRVADALLALPLLPLLLVASALDVGRPTTTAGAIGRVVLLLSAFSWMTVARLARAQATSALSLDHVRGARALGAGGARIVMRHVLPLTLPPVIVQVTLEVGSNILAESALSFLGLGIQPPTASWGNMLMSALDVLKSDPPSAFLPGAAILVTVVCVQVVGDAVRDRL